MKTTCKVQGVSLLTAVLLSMVLLSPACGAELSREMPQPVRKATFADTIVDAIDRLGTWERAWQATVPTPGLSYRSWHVIGPIPRDVPTDALVDGTWQPFDFAKPLRLGNRGWTWCATPALDANGVPHLLHADPGAKFLLARDVLYAPPANPPRGDWKFTLALEKGSYSEWLPGRNMRCEHSDFPFFTYGAHTPKLQPTNQVFAVLQANARGEARLFFDVKWLSDRVHPGSTWQYGDRRFKLQDACEALFPDPVDRHLIGYHKSASLWMHAQNPYTYGFQFVPGCAEEFKAMRLPAGFEEACLHADVTNLVAALVPARAAVADLAATFPDWRAHAAAHNAELDAIAREAAAVESLPGVKARVAAYLALEARRRKVLLDNPVLNAAPLVMAKGQVSLNTNFEGPNILGQTLVKWDPAAPEKGEETIAAFKGAWGGFSDFDIHWNADRILYSDRHHLYEYTVADRKTRTITAAADPEVNHYDACYLPNGRICSVCNACWQTVPCVAARNVGNLHLLDADGSNERRITYDQDHNWNPVVAEDGRVLFSRWEYEDTPHYFPRLVMRMNPDGSSQMEHYGSNSYWPNSLFWPIPIPGQPNRFVALVTGHHYASRAGLICLFDTRRGRHEADGVVQAIPGRGRKVEPVIKDRLVEGVWPLYSAPYPLACGSDNKGAGKYFLASRRLNASAGWDLCLLDVFDNVTPIRPVAVENGRLVSYISARPFVKRPMPRVIPDRVDPAATNATIYLVDIYKGDGLKGYPRGSIKRLRLGTYEYRYFGNGFTFANAYEGGWDIKKILGEVPVNADGSAIFHVPANTAVFVQPLDADGKAQALMRSWYNAMPGEVGSCVGCHEAQNSIPPTTLNAAAHAAPSEIEPVSGPSRAFSFEREIQPILSRRCAGCHDERAEREKGRPDFRDKRLGRPAENPARIGWWGWLGTPQYNPHLKKEGDHFSPSYWRLQRYVRRAGLEADYHLLPPAEFEADTSMLVQMLKRGHHGVALTPEEWRLLYTWIDCNVPYYANYTESSMPPNPVDVACRIRYDRLYSHRENHDEDPVPVPPIPAFEPPRAAPPPAPAATPVAVPPGYRPVVRELKLPSGATMRFVQIPGTSYGLGECEVSNAQFAEFDPKHDSRYAEGRDKDRTTRGTPLNRPEQPVCRVTWREAQAFCDWLSRVTGADCSLPTEAEWRAGCVGGAAPNIAGAELKRWNYGRFEKGHSDGVLFAAPVTWGRPNALGLRNMLGNVREWTASEWRRPASDPDDPSVRRMVVKGGSWCDTRREANPDWSWRYADYKPVFDVGFRVKLAFAPARAEIKWTRTICAEPGRYLGWPTVCRLQNGDLLTVFSGDRAEHVCPYGKVQMVRSKDEGATWSAPVTIADGLLDDRDAGVVQLPDGEVVVTWFTSIAFTSSQVTKRHPEYLRDYGKLPPDVVKENLGYYLIRSRDNGVTWSKPEKLAQCDQTPHGPIVLKDGSLLQIGRRTEKDALAASRNAFDRTIISVSRSTDQGRTWTYLCPEIPAAKGENDRPGMFHEPHVAELADGTLVGMVRYHGAGGEHAVPGHGYMRITFSKDGGRSWTPMSATPLLGLPPHLLVVPEGPLVCVYGRRLANPGFGEFACLSDDGGKTWDVAHEIRLSPAVNGDLGYPASCLLANGDILTVYYQHLADQPKTVLMATRWRVK